MGTAINSRRIHVFLWVWLAAFFLPAALPIPACAQTIQWIRQFGSTGIDQARGIAVDGTGIYVVGNTASPLPGQTSAGGFVRKYDANGNELWTRRLDDACGVATHTSGIYVAGSRYVRKYDASGNELLTFGSPDPGGRDLICRVVVEGSIVYAVGAISGALSGQTGAGRYDVVVHKFDTNGTGQWSRQFGTAGDDDPRGVAADATGVYVVGVVDGVLPGQTRVGGQDAFVRKYDVDGNEVWTRQFGSTSPDSAAGVAVDGTGVYVVGGTYCCLPGQTDAGGQDAFVRKYDPSGNELWARQFGSTRDDSAAGVAWDATGIYVVGAVGGGGSGGGSLPGQTSAGLYDGFVRKSDGSGNELWTRQFGTASDDLGQAVALDATGIYVGGDTFGVLPGQTRVGGRDTFVVKLAAGSAQPPAVSDGGVVNNASFAPGPAPVAPGSIAAVFGSNLNDGSSVLFSSFGSDGKLVTSLGGASVTINNIPAPLFYSIPTQLGIQIPFELAGQTSATIQVTVGGQTSVSRTIFLDALAPGIFTLSQDGKGAAAVLHEDGVTPVTAQSPARPGETVVLFATGLGAVTPPLATGAPSTGNLTVSTATVTIDGIPATVEFSGTAPGFVGLNQINVRIPSSTRSAPNIPLVLSIGGKQSNPVTIAVSP